MKRRSWILLCSRMFGVLISMDGSREVLVVVVCADYGGGQGVGDGGNHCSHGTRSAFVDVPVSVLDSVLC